MRDLRAPANGSRQGFATARRSLPCDRRDSRAALREVQHAARAGRRRPCDLAGRGRLPRQMGRQVSLFGAPEPARTPEVGMLKPYEVEQNGITTTVMLNDEDA